MNNNKKVDKGEIMYTQKETQVSKNRGEFT